MPNPKAEEGVLGLKDNLPARLLCANLADNLAEVCAILSLYASWRIPPELVTRLRAIEAELRELSRLCQAPPSTPKRNEKVRISEIPLF